MIIIFKLFIIYLDNMTYIVSYCPMKDNNKYSIGELADKAGVSRRAIRFYVQNGVIPPPAGLGRGSYYTDEHLTRILKKKQKVAQVKQIISNKHDTEECTDSVKYVSRIHLNDNIVLEIPASYPVPDVEILEKIKDILSIKNDENKES